MAEFNIVHLSDLHIDNENKERFDTGEQFTVLRNLINDIGTRTKDMQNIIVVVTGDIVDRGKYGDFDNEDKNPALVFFKNLFKKFTSNVDGVFSNRLIDVQICPGNHDKNISFGKEHAKLLQGYSPDSPDWKNHQKEMDDEDWSKLKGAFDNFLRLTNRIYEIFNEICNKGSEVKKRHVDKTYGVEFIKIKSDFYTLNEDKKQKLDLVLSFIRLNTAFISVGEPEEVEQHRLLAGKVQRDYIKRTYKEERNAIMREEKGVVEDDFVTFCLSHYPLDFLKNIDEQEMKKILLDKNELSSEFFLYGHTHERETISFAKNKNKVSCFETGIGWYYTGETRHNDGYKYSIYTFNREKNIYSTTMLKSDMDMRTFLYDTSYMGDNVKRIVHPWRLKDQPFIKPKTQNADSTISEYFVDSEALDELQKMSENHLVFKEQCLKALQKLLFIKMESKLKVFKKARLHGERGHTLEEKVKECFVDHRNFTYVPIENILDAKNAMLGLISHFIIDDIQNKKDIDNYIFSLTLDKLYRVFEIKSHEDCLCFDGDEDDDEKKCKHSRICESYELYKNCYKCEDFLLYIEYVALLIIKCFKSNFEKDEIRVIIRGHDNKKRTKGKTKGIGDEETHVNDLYRPIYETSFNGDKPKSGIDRAYNWQNGNIPLITAVAFNDGNNTAPRIYSLNKGMVDFEVDNWKDFIVITPKEFFYEIGGNNDGYGMKRPGISIVISVKLKEIEGESLVDTKKRFKQLSNKLYLLEHIGIQKTIDKVISKFTNAYGLDVVDFIKDLDLKNRYKLPEGCVKIDP